MPLVQPHDSVFHEFEKAGTVDAGPTDVLDDIQKWLRSVSEALARMAHDQARLKAEAQALGKDGYVRQWMFSDTFPVAAAAKEAWEFAARIMGERYVAPKCITLDVPEFLDEVLRLPKRHERREYDEKTLLRWDAAAIRRAFDARFPDLSEEAVRQLREKAMAHIGRHRPGVVFETYSNIHEFAHSGKMRMGYTHAPLESFTAFVRFVIYLATGRPVAEIETPEFLGFCPPYGANGKAVEWERAELLKRQKNPFPGVEWLRFTASGYCEIKLTQDVLTRLSGQWEAYGKKS